VLAHIHGMKHNAIPDAEPSQGRRVVYKTGVPSNARAGVHMAREENLIE
jgi:hypothetical protein